MCFFSFSDKKSTSPPAIEVAEETQQEDNLGSAADLVSF